MSSALEAKQRLAAIVLLSMLCGCSGDESGPPKDVATQPVSIGALPARYAGVLPCADCEGIRYELDLRDASSFVLRKSYLGRPATGDADETGAWSLSTSGRVSLQGLKEGPELFELVDARTLRKLDRNGQRIKSELNYDLSRQEPYAGLIRPQVKVGGIVTHELAGTRWALRKLRDRDVTIRDGAREPFLVLETAQHRIVGLAGCNRMTGGYELRGAQLRFSQMVTTRMACPDMTTEGEFLAALDATVKWRITDETLELLNAAGESVATLVARDL